MKISSIGINAYQEMAGQTHANRKPAVAENTEQTQKTGRIHIPDRVDRVGSELSVKLKGADYAKMLAPEEKQALELLFDRYGDKKGIANSNTTNRPDLGTFVDIKL